MLFNTSLTITSGLIKKFKYPPAISTFETTSSSDIFSLSSSAIIFGAYLSSLASLKHGNA